MGVPLGGRRNINTKRLLMHRACTRSKEVLKCQDLMGPPDKMGSVKHPNEEMTELMEACKQMMNESTPSEKRGKD